MASPAPGIGIGTPYGKRGHSWTCNANSSGGLHTGVDYPCPAGTRLVAAVAGTVRHRAYGSAFGSHQFAISPSPGQPFADGEVFYAHCRTRLPDGTEVQAGDFVAESGAEGNVTGPHLHFEYHPSKKGVWNCSVHADPAPVIAHGGGAPPPQSGGWLYPAGTEVHAKYLAMRGHELNSDGKSISIGAWQDMLNHHHLEGGTDLPVTEQWFDMTAAETQKCQAQHVPPADSPLDAVFVGPSQFEHVRAATGAPYVWAG